MLKTEALPNTEIEFCALREILKISSGVKTKTRNLYQIHARYVVLSLIYKKINKVIDRIGNGY